jgi:ABC-type glycerol-3-phosphate transport system substrate-binding protein
MADRDRRQAVTMIKGSRTRVRWRHLGAIAVAATLLTPALAGCGSDGGSGDSKTLEFWSQWRQGEPQQKILQDAINAFQEKTGITVKVQWTGREVGKKIRAGANVGKVPDLTDDSSESLWLAHKNGQGLGLADVYQSKLGDDDGSRTVADAVPANSVAAYSTQDGPVLVPYMVLTTSLWFDGGALPDVAANPPTTVDQFVATLDRIKQSGKAPIAADGTISDYNAYWLYQAAQHYMGAGWLHRAAEDKTGQMWSDPKFLEAAKLVERLVKGGYFIDGYEGSKLPAGQQRWAKGDAGFLLMGSWAPADTSSYAKPGFDYRSIPFPTPDGQPGPVETNFIGFGIPKKAKQADAAKQFIAFFMSKKWLSQIATKAQNLTPDPGIPAPAALKDVQAMLANAKSTHRPADGLSGDLPDYWSGVFVAVDDNLFFGKATAEQTVQELQKRTVEYWKSR